MGQYLAKRLVLFIPTVLLVSLLVFLVMNIIPGDPAMMILMGEQGEREVHDDFDSLVCLTFVQMHISSGKFPFSPCSIFLSVVMLHAC